MSLIERLHFDGEGVEGTVPVRSGGMLQMAAHESVDDFLMKPSAKDHHAMRQTASDTMFILALLAIDSSLSHVGQFRSSISNGGRGGSEMFPCTSKLAVCSVLSVIYNFILAILKIGRCGSGKAVVPGAPPPYPVQLQVRYPHKNWPPCNRIDKNCPALTLARC